jgi:hypothetical protein
MSVLILSKLRHRLSWHPGSECVFASGGALDLSDPLALSRALLSHSGGSIPSALRIDGVGISCEHGLTELEPGAHVALRWTGKCFCTSCGALTRKLMSGYCYSCFQSRAEADSCVMSPEKCHYLRGTCREPEWGLSFCFQPHVVYLSYTGDFKVGITRFQQLAYRWCDQGATWAVPIALVGSRHQAGVVENAIRARYSDRTSWQKMLKDGNNVPDQDRWREALTQLRAWVQGSVAFAGVSLRVSCPPVSPEASHIEWLASLPTEIRHAPPPPQESSFNSLTFEKFSEIEEPLLGFKGQYLFFPSGVFNVRRHEGFEVNLQLT